MLPIVDTGNNWAFIPAWGIVIGRPATVSGNSTDGSVSTVKLIYARYCYDDVCGARENSE
jgi:hypothetical protein